MNGTFSKKLIIIFHIQNIGSQTFIVLELANFLIIKSLNDSQNF